MDADSSPAPSESPAQAPDRRSRRKKPFTKLELFVACFVCTALLGVGGFDLYHRLTSRDGNPLLFNNAKQIFLASFSMANDYAVNNDPKLGWPGDIAVSAVEPANTLEQFAARLVEYDYIRRPDLPKLFGSPGLPQYPGTGPFKSEYSEFKIYRARGSDVASCLFLATRNYTFRKDLDAKAKPYGSRGGCIVRMGGDMIPFYSNAEALKLPGCMPGHYDVDRDPGEETSESILAM